MIQKLARVSASRPELGDHRAVVTIRRIRPDDGPGLREVRLRALQTDPDAFAATHTQTVPRADEEWVRIAAGAASGGEEVIFVAETEKGFVGLIGAFTRPEEPATRHLYSMWVAPEARGSRLGLGLVEAILDWSRTAGADVVKLWVVESNTPAVNLYKEVGFEPTGEAQPLPSNPALTDTRMRLALT